MTTYEPIPDYGFHPYAAIFPMMKEGKNGPFEQLVENIAGNSLLEPIVLYEGKVIDGRNRYKACVLSKTAARFVELNDIKPPDLNPMDWVVSMNLHRRQLTRKQQNAALIAYTSMWSDLVAKRRQQDGAKQTNAARWKKDDDLVKNNDADEHDYPVAMVNLPTRQASPDEEAPAALPQSRDEVAEMFGTSASTVGHARAIHRHGAPGLAGEVGKKLSISAAANIARNVPRADQAGVIQNIQQAETKQEVRSIIRKALPSPAAEQLSYQAFAGLPDIGDVTVSRRAVHVLLAIAEGRDHPYRDAAIRALKSSLKG